VTPQLRAFEVEIEDAVGMPGQNIL